MMTAVTSLAEHELCDDYRVTAGQSRVGSQPRRPFHVTPTPGANPWNSVFQNAGLAPLFVDPGGLRENNEDKLSAPRTIDKASISKSQEAVSREAPGIDSSQMSVDPGSKSASLESVFEYLAARNPQNTKRSCFAGSRLANEKARGETKSKQPPAFESPPTFNSIQYKTTSAVLGRQAGSRMTEEEAAEFLEHAKKSPIMPAKTYWESDEMRGALVSELESQMPTPDSPGSSWVMRPGALPPPRTMVKAFDKMAQVKVLSPDRVKMLTNLRWQFFVQGIFTEFDLLEVVRDYANAHSAKLRPSPRRGLTHLPSRTASTESSDTCHVPVAMFFSFLKKQGVELTTSVTIMLEQMFMSASTPGYIDYEQFVYTLVDATIDLPRPPAKVQSGQEAVAKNRASCIFDGLDSLRPKSRSGRFYSFTDIKNQCEKPLVIPAGTQKSRGMYQFMSEREERMLHQYRDREPLRDGYRPQDEQIDPEPKPFPGRSLPKRVSTPKGLKTKSYLEEAAEIAAMNAASNAAQHRNVGVGAREICTPSKGRGRTVDFMLLCVTPEPENRASTTPNNTAYAQEQQSPTNVVDAAETFAYFRPLVGNDRAATSSPTQYKGVIKEYKEANKFAANFHDKKIVDRQDLSNLSGARLGRDALGRVADRLGENPGLRVETAKTALHVGRPPAWDVEWRHTFRPVNMLEKISHSDPDGQNSPSGWGSTNACNKDILGGEEARQEILLQGAENQKMNANKRQTNWSYAHMGSNLNPSDWASTTQDQMLSKPRLRTPKKHPISLPPDLREPPWAVAERHQVHLMKYDHRLVGLRKPESLAKNAS